jgi:RHS repeat-associated protein
VLASNQVTAGQTYSFGYGYNLAGALTSETYPSGRVVTTVYDGANRPATINGTLQGQTKPYAYSISYWPQGALWYYGAGNNMAPVYNYNNRLQLGQSYATIGSSTSNYLAVSNYNWGATINNGVLQSVSEGYGPSVPYSSLSWLSQSYGYDRVNRLTSVNDTGYSRSFQYDQYGNMWVTGNSGVPLAGNTPTSNVYTNNRNTTTNYDNAGNQLVVNGDTLSYDAENRQSSATDGVTHGTQTYAYNGLGQRVKKAISGGPSTVYVYDAFGQLASEYSTSTATNTISCTTCYPMWDHLGSTRFVTDQNGSVIGRHDYLPFGEEIPAGTAGRSGPWGAGSDNVAQKFTGQIRDSETGIDYFNARYFGAALGRFTSPDPANAGADLTNPQSWNGYGYVLGNPLGNVDPTGMSIVPCEDPNSIACVGNDPEPPPRAPGPPGCIAYGTEGCIRPPCSVLITTGCTGPVSIGGGPTGGGGGSGGGLTASPPKNGTLGLTNRQACYSDALVNGALGFVPGYNATKTVASLVGFNFNPVQFLNGNTGPTTGVNSGATPFAAGSSTGPQVVAGIASAGAIGADASYAASGGAAALTRANDLISRSSFALQTASRQGRLLQQAASLERLANVASAAKNLGTFFSLASTAFDLYQCSQKP